ncbi:hypothetical protein [Bordetella genomosp. 1]|uniref:Uncharacterized protein n=1 Tax=Bordetella genomosp. 1 TaxID=1395607 RepID=A0ABX4EUJ3_9BORD|nr:hypothetical protein [Bordetella genomosp. 1]MDQ8033235.1 hypothetical protein [Bordetella sp.]OZI57877.1 hypothetical protein CAL27_20990 [Bordetella genomosp. 1]
MNGRTLTGDDLLWNWARWTWSGAVVGNMAPHLIEDDDEARPINDYHAQRVQAMHDALPWHERMAVIAEYPQKHARFGALDARARAAAACAWIADTTGVVLTQAQYQIYVGMFREAVARRIA